METRKEDFYQNLVCHTKINILFISKYKSWWRLNATDIQNIKKKKKLYLPHEAKNEGDVSSKYGKFCRTKK